MPHPYTADAHRPEANETENFGWDHAWPHTGQRLPRPADGKVSRPLAGLNVSSESPLLFSRSLINLSTLSMDTFQSCSVAYGSVGLAVISFYSCPCLDHTEYGVEFWLLGKQHPLEKKRAVSFSVACAGEFNWEEGFVTTHSSSSGFSAS